MKYLVSVPREMEKDKRWTTRREPVVPCFPSQHTGAFLTVPSFLLADKAEVAETDADADEMASALTAEYPGLPRVLHENYVFAVWKAVINAPLGTCGIFKFPPLVTHAFKLILCNPDLR